MSGGINFFLPQGPYFVFIFPVFLPQNPCLGLNKTSAYQGFQAMSNRFLQV